MDRGADTFRVRSSGFSGRWFYTTIRITPDGLLGRGFMQIFRVG